MKDLKTRFKAKRVAVINLEDEIKELKEENSKLKTNATLGLGIHIGAYTVKPVLKATCVTSNINATILIIPYMILY